MSILFHQVSKLQEVSSTIRRRKVLPCRVLESFSSGFDGNVNVLDAGSVDARDFLLVARIIVSLNDSRGLLKTHAGLIVANFSPEVDFTNSLLMNNPIGCWTLREFGAVNSWITADMLR